MSSKTNIIGKDMKMNLMNGYYSSKDKLPTEAKLMEKYKVSRNTIRKVLQNLELEGLIYSIQGSGYYVRDADIIDSITLKSLEEVSTTISTFNTVLEFSEMSAKSSVAAELKIQPGAPVFFFKRLRYKNGLPFMLEETYMPKNLFPDFSRENAKNSIFKYVEQTLQKPISYSIRHYTSMLLSNSEKDIFQLPIDLPQDAIKVHSIGFLENSQVFEVSNIIEVNASHVYIARRN